MTEIWAVGLILTATVIGGFGSVFLKQGADKLKLNIKGILFNKMLIKGVSLYTFSSVFFITGLRGGELSVLYPLVSLSYVWVCIFSIKFLGERMNKWKWTGVLFILLGVSLIGLGS
ncbi:MAG: EamA family transporter [Candidatus Altiarchaeota archaeon]